MIVLARLEAEHGTMQEVLADLDKAEDALRPVLTDGSEITDEHYERMPSGEAHPPYFKGRRVFKLASIVNPVQNPAMLQTFTGGSATASGGFTNVR